MHRRYVVGSMACDGVAVASTPKAKQLSASPEAEITKVDV